MLKQKSVYPASLNSFTMIKPISQSIMRISNLGHFTIEKAELHPMASGAFPFPYIQATTSQPLSIQIPRIPPAHSSMYITTTFKPSLSPSSTKSSPSTTPPSKSIYPWSRRPRNSSSISTKEPLMNIWLSGGSTYMDGKSRIWMERIPFTTFDYYYYFEVLDRA